MRQPDPPDPYLPDPYLPVYGRGGPPQGEPVRPAPRRSRNATAPQNTVMLWKLTLAQWTVLSGGALAVLGTLLPWYSVNFVLATHHQSISISGWDVPTGKVTLLLGAAGVILLLLQRLKMPLPARLADREVLIYLVLGAQAFILAFLYLLDGPTVITSGSFYSSGAGFGLYLTLIGAAAMTLGGYLRRRDRGSWLL
jgi:hypothetical protein